MSLTRLGVEKLAGLLLELTWTSWDVRAVERAYRVGSHAELTHAKKSGRERVVQAIEEHVKAAMSA